MTSPVTFTQQDRIGILRIDNPPVNALSVALVIHCA
jgi:enoyl-CoA hydratase/carnithine racemase